VGASLLLRLRSIKARRLGRGLLPFAPLGRHKVPATRLRDADRARASSLRRSWRESKGNRGNAPFRFGAGGCLVTHLPPPARGICSPRPPPGRPFRVIPRVRVTSDTPRRAPRFGVRQGAALVHCAGRERGSATRRLACEPAGSGGGAAAPCPPSFSLSSPRPRPAPCRTHPPTHNNNTPIANLNNNNRPRKNKKPTAGVPLPARLAGGASGGGGSSTPTGSGGSGVMVAGAAATAATATSRRLSGSVAAAAVPPGPGAEDRPSTAAAGATKKAGSGGSAGGAASAAASDIARAAVGGLTQQLDGTKASPKASAGAASPKASVAAAASSAAAPAPAAPPPPAAAALTPEDYWSPAIDVPSGFRYEDDYGAITPVPEHDGTACFQWDDTLWQKAEHFKYRWQRFKALREAVDASEGGLAQFAQGYNYYGLNRGTKDGKQGLFYREWAPGARSLALVGDFNEWEPKPEHWAQKNEFGTFELFLPDAADGTRAVPHRCRVKCRVELADGSWADRIPAWIKWATQAWNEVLFNGAHWEPEGESPPGELQPDKRYVFKHPRPPKPRALRIYECHVGMSSQEPVVNTYVDFKDNVLPRIRRLGYNAIQIMAVQVCVVEADVAVFFFPFRLLSTEGKKRPATAPTRTPNSTPPPPTTPPPPKKQPPNNNAGARLLRLLRLPRDQLLRRLVALRHARGAESPHRRSPPLGDGRAHGHRAQPRQQEHQRRHQHV
jgi:hypothetical protein